MGPGPTVRFNDDDFSLFGLPRRFALNTEALDARWRELQAQVHPDQFAAEGAAAQRVAAQWSTRLNQAHRRLRDPVQRGAYLCELRGQPIDAERHTAMPPAFLMQQMEWREALEAAQRLDEVDRLQAQVQAECEALLAGLERLLDGPEAHGPGAPLEGAAQQVRSLMFLQKFQLDIHPRADALDPL